MSPIEPHSVVQWYRRFAPALVLYARQWLDPAEAEDVVQEAFASLIVQPREPASPQAWLFRVVRNASLHAVRSRRRRRRHEAARAGHSNGWFHADVTQPLDGRIAEAALRRLEPDQREVIVLRIWGQLAWREIAELTGRPTSTLFSQYERGLKSLRERLESSCPKNES